MNTPQTADAINRPQMGSVSDTQGTIMMEAEDEIRALKAQLTAANEKLEKARSELEFVHRNWWSCSHDATSSCRICKALRETEP